MSRIAEKKIPLEGLCWPETGRPRVRYRPLGFVAIYPRLRQRGGIFSVGVVSPCETDEIVRTVQKQETPPAIMAGFPDAFAVDAARWTATAVEVPNAREIYPNTPTQGKR